MLPLPSSAVTPSKHLERRQGNHTVVHSSLKYIFLPVRIRQYYEIKQIQLDRCENRNQKKKNGIWLFFVPYLPRGCQCNPGFNLPFVFRWHCFSSCPSLFSTLRVYLQFREIYTKTPLAAVVTKKKKSLWPSEISKSLSWQRFVLNFRRPNNTVVITSAGTGHCVLPFIKMSFITSLPSVKVAVLQLDSVFFFSFLSHQWWTLDWTPAQDRPHRSGIQRGLLRKTIFWEKNENEFS